MKDLESAVVEALRKERIKLWIAPYKDCEAKVYEVAEKLAQDIGETDVQAVHACSLDLRSRALEKLQAKRYNIRFIVRLAGKTNRSIEMCLDGRIRGHEARKEIAIAIGLPAISRALARGRQLIDDMRLVDQGFCKDAQVNLIVWESTSESTHEIPSPPPEALLARAAALLAEKRDLLLNDSQTTAALPASPDAKKALLVGLVLHAKGHAILDASGGQPEACTLALPYLIDADTAFKRPALIETNTKIDNPSLLQLDICRCYAIIEDAAALPDAEARLHEASTIIYRRLDPRFIQLCLQAARRGQVVPPEIIPLTRLLLLTAVLAACRHQGNHSKQTELRTETFQDAANLLNALRISEHLIEPLLLLGASRSSAIAAIRRAEGNVDKAAAAILDVLTKSRTTSKLPPLDAHKLDQLRILAPAAGLEAAAKALRRRNNNLNAALNDLLDNTTAIQNEATDNLADSDEYDKQESEASEEPEEEHDAFRKSDSARYAEARAFVEREVGDILSGSADPDASDGCDLHLEDILLARWAPACGPPSTS